MSKLLFFDIDGTLVGFDRKMPESTQDALNKARANGHKIFLCTGRSLGQIYPFLMDFGFDGIVGAAGAYVTYGDTIIEHHTFGTKMMTHMLHTMERRGGYFFLQNTDNCVLTDVSLHVMGKLLGSGFGIKDAEDYKGMLEAVIGPVVVDDELDKYAVKHADTESVVYSDCPVPLSIMQQDLGSKFKVTASSIDHPVESRGEITIAGVNKATGIQAVMNHLNTPIEDVYAFGDGPNDLEMLSFAGTSVAMGNAQDKVKEISDIVTDHINENGIYNALVKLGII